MSPYPRIFNILWTCAMLCPCPMFVSIHLWKGSSTFRVGKRRLQRVKHKHSDDLKTSSSRAEWRFKWSYYVKRKIRFSSDESCSSEFIMGKFIRRNTEGNEKRKGKKKKSSGKMRKALIKHKQNSKEKTWQSLNLVILVRSELSIFFCFSLLFFSPSSAQALYFFSLRGISMCASACAL